MLRWARERAGYSVEDIARRRRVSPDRVRAWEAGDSFPTWRQLEQLAYNDYHRGTVFFFFSTPPDEKTIEEQFPRLPVTTLTDLHPDTLYAVRQARVRQDDFAQLVSSEDGGERFVLHDLGGQIDPNNSVVFAAVSREYLGVRLDEQKTWAGYHTALDEWRRAMENAGIRVMKRSFRQKDVTGFCLNDDAFPIICLNSGQPKPRQIFTLLNEFGHLLFDFNHLELNDVEHHLAHMSDADRRVEIACQQFAGSTLIPDADFGLLADSGYEQHYFDQYVTDLARTYWAGEEVVLKKLLDRQIVDLGFYRQTLGRWRSERAFNELSTSARAASSSPTERPPAEHSRSGRSYYGRQASYLGEKYISEAFKAFEEGRIDESELADYLGVKGRHLDGLRPYASR